MKNNKILKVSYGTFSCTLEGFDDPFAAMKDVVAYFRDLAEDDPGFGTEPLRPAEEDRPGSAAPVVVATAVPEDVIATPIAETPDAPDFQDGIAGLAPETDRPEEDAAETPTPESNTSDDVQPAPPDEDATAEDESAAEDAAAPSAPETGSDPEVKKKDLKDLPAEADATGQEDVDADPHPPDAPPEAEAFFADSPAPVTLETEVDAERDAPTVRASVDAPAPIGPPEAAAESIAAKLQRIRNVVSHHPDEAYEDDMSDAAQQPLIHPEDIREFAGDVPDDVAQPPGDEEISAATEGPDTASASASDGQGDTDEDDDLAAVLNRLEADHTSGTDNLFAPDDENTPPEEPEEVDETLFDDTGDGGDAPGDTPVPDSAPTQQPGAARGRVLKVGRADLEAALDAGDLEEFDDTTPADTARDGGGSQLAQGVRAETDVAQADTPAGRSGLPAMDRDADQDVSRLMAEADHQMEEPEGATRRSAFSHLRAAVAARFADRTMRKDPSDDQATSAYRNDLEQAVKPRRPVASGPRTERPAEPRPTPLKLVAEQRVDGRNPGQADPVLPRRVAATLEDDPDFAEDTGFAGFAEQAGAVKLTDILEAAAAHLTFVEGYADFSRPQLMARVRQAASGNFSREDGLRSFGQLLRAGKIRRIEGGRFSASDDISYKPDDARAVS